VIDSVARSTGVSRCSMLCIHPAIAAFTTPVGSTGRRGGGQSTPVSPRTDPCRPRGVAGAVRTDAVSGTFVTATRSGTSLAEITGSCARRHSGRPTKHLTTLDGGRNLAPDRHVRHTPRCGCVMRGTRERRRTGGMAVALHTQ
jgi:hypothetical protein